ncbi:MAG: NrdH-redoxin [Parcubacteria group bacterium CG11_big_fil_rev_8_21_14_0_20_39_22]|nr:MAG: NrdH-redoxin [Parcubacteria group bacterium CG11_big_fil_rev_8_21_14_0_20_39_22]
MDITIYTKRGCPWCDGARTFLKESKVEFKEKEVLGNSKYFDELREVSGQDKAPTMVIDGEVLADTDADEIEASLRQKGIIS